jgi:peptidylprolyl isomerase
MKACLAILVIALALLCSSCGGDDAATGSGRGASESAGGPGRSEPYFPKADDPRFATFTGGAGRRAELELDPADRPPPKQFIARDLEVGSGAVAHLGDRVAVWYMGINYQTGVGQFGIWPPRPKPLIVQLGLYGAGWEKGIVGMRVGGRREVIVPSSLTVNTGALDYVFDLVSVERDGETVSGG